MPFVLTKSSSITCAGQGNVQTSGQPKLKVSNAEVLRVDGIQGQSIPDCKTVTDANSGSKKCTTVATASGAATKLKVSGAPVALATLTGTGDGMITSTPEKLTASANQTKLMAS